MAIFDHQTLVNEFKNDLQSMDTVSLIRKHITTGPSAVLTATEYYDLRNEVADHFGLHPSQVVVIGSCRTGFSLKPRQLYQACQDGSDVDLAVVSREKFEAYWDLVFEHWRARRYWPTKRYRRFLVELFRGWMWPRRLPPSRNFRAAFEWVEFEDRLTRERFRGIRSVEARLYRSWASLEAYQAIHVMDCKTTR
jgi:predicted nucleotidyltransferase